MLTVVILCITFLIGLWMLLDAIKEIAHEKLHVSNFPYATGYRTGLEQGRAQSQQGESPTEQMLSLHPPFTNLRLLMATRMAMYGGGVLPAEAAFYAPIWSVVLGSASLSTEEDNDHADPTNC